MPDDRTLVIERCLDDLGDWRVCLLSPLGSRIHAPWAMAVTAQIRRQTGIDVEVMWGDEGFVVRFPEVEQPPDPRCCCRIRTRSKGSSAAARLDVALRRSLPRDRGRALLLPRRRPGMRTPLWQQRKRASDLLAVASRFGSFPALLETYREVLARPLRHAGARRPAAAVSQHARSASRRSIRARRRPSRRRCSSATSPTTSTTATRRWQNDALRRSRSIRRSCASCSAMPSCASCSIQPRSTRSNGSCSGSTRAAGKTADGIHDLLLRVGDLTREEIQALLDVRCGNGDRRSRAGGAHCRHPRVAGERRYIAVEDAARYRDALGVTLPAGSCGLARTSPRSRR